MSPGFQRILLGMCSWFLENLTRSDGWIMRTTRAKTPLAIYMFGLRPGSFTLVALLLYELRLLNGSRSSSASHYSPSTSIQCLLYESLLYELKLLKGSKCSSASHGSLLYEVLLFELRLLNGSRSSSASQWATSGKP